MTTSVVRAVATDASSSLPLGQPGKAPDAPFHQAQTQKHQQHTGNLRREKGPQAGQQPGQGNDHQGRQDQAPGRGPQAEVGGRRYEGGHAHETRAVHDQVSGADAGGAAL